MEPISQVDHLVGLLRQRLKDRDRVRTGKRGPAPKPEGASGLSAAHALAAIDDVDERQLRRALIQGLLADQFGQGMINEPRFQQIVDRVVGAIDSEPAGRELLDRITRELRAAAR